MLETLTLHNFRLYENRFFSFKEKINIIEGENGIGKTSILEAIFFLGNAGSFRTNKNKELIKTNREYFSILAKINKDEYKVIFDGNKKMFFKNELKIEKIKDHIGSLNINCFYPEFIYILKEAPKTRRKQLDRELSKIDNIYLSNLIKYNNLIKDRNFLLKSNDKYKKNLIKVLDKKIIPIQKYIICKRKKFLDDLSLKLNFYANEFDLGKEFKIKYISTINLENENHEKQIEEMLNNNFGYDLETKYTQKGIHKEDWKVMLNNEEVDKFFSQGELRIVSLIFVLALIQIVEEEKKEKPILLLDDVYFELSNKNKDKLNSILKNISQVIITTCDIKSLPIIKEKNSYHHLKIEKGEVQ